MRLFLAGMLAGQLLFALTLRFLMVPAVGLNWRVIAGECVVLAITLAFVARVQLRASRRTSHG